MSTDEPNKQISPAHLDRDDPSPSSIPRRTDVDDQRPMVFSHGEADLRKTALPYTFNGLDREGPERSDAEAFQAALKEDDAVILPVWRRKVLMSGNADDLLAVPADMIGDGAEVVFLGRKDGVAHFVADLSAQDDLESKVGAKSYFIDPWMVGPNLDPFRVGVGAYGRHLIAWHRSHRFCGRCGSKTELARGGLERKCTGESCGQPLFPRINPATIMLVQDPSGERCVMARNHNFPPTIHSILAGYVDAGETLEQTVVREVQEEVGLTVGRVRYVASQPWAFSNSLMLGFFAWSTDTEMNVDFNELEKADWYTRQDLQDLRGSTEFRFPRRDSIARFMIEQWVKSPPEAL